MIEITLTAEEVARCLKLAYDRKEVTEENFSYATQDVWGAKQYYQYELEAIGTMAECAFAIWHDLPDETWSYIGRRAGSTDFKLNGKAVEVKATNTPPTRDPHLAILPTGKRSDLYVLAYTELGFQAVYFFGYATNEDFPKKPTVLPGWRNPTLNIRASKLKRFKEDSVAQEQDPALEAEDRAAGGS